MAAHMTGIEAVRLAGKGFSAFNPQTSFDTFPLELDGIITILVCPFSNDKIVL